MSHVDDLSDEDVAAAKIAFAASSGDDKTGRPRSSNLGAATRIDACAKTIQSGAPNSAISARIDLDIYVANPAVSPVSK